MFSTYCLFESEPCSMALVLESPRRRSMHLSESRVAHALIFRTLLIHESEKSRRIFFRCLFSMKIIAASGSDCSALFSFFFPSSVFCHAWRHLFIISNPSSHARLRHVLHVAENPGTSRKSFLGQFRSRTRCSSPHLDKPLLSRSQIAPRSTRVGQPYWAEAEPAEELSVATLMPLGGR